MSGCYSSPILASRPRSVNDSPRSYLPYFTISFPTQSKWSVGKLCTLVVGDEQVNHTSLVEVVTALIPDDDWDIAICLTDLPRRSQLRSLVAELDPEQRCWYRWLLSG